MSKVTEGSSLSILKDKTIDKILESLSPHKRVGLRKLLEQECTDYNKTKACAEKYLLEPVQGNSAFELNAFFPV